ncbi:MAG: ABC transporter permease [Acidobacteriota bacterium]|nr:ABC transporter permease [Acidobacteriota bacterium]
MSRYTGLKAVFKREFRGYFATPLGYIFMVVFLIAAGLLTVSRDFGRFLELRQASLDSFFNFLPWLFVALAPAVAMRLWAEERKTGTVELLFTLPITLRGSYLGKFLAGWSFMLVSLALTCPVVFVVAWLGDPDWGTIITGYLACALCVGLYLAIGMTFSAMTKNQVVAFILGLAASMIFLNIGRPQSLEVFSSIAGIGGYLEQLAASMSIIDHFNSLTRGLIELRTLAFFGISTLGWLAAGMALLDEVKAS